MVHDCPKYTHFSYTRSSPSGAWVWLSKGLPSIFGIWRHLKQRYKMASEQEKPGLLLLMEDIWKQIRVLGRKERIRQKRRERRKKREAFLRNPYGFVRGLFQSCSSGTIMAPQAELEEHLRKTCSNPLRSVDLPDLGGFDRPPEPGVTFVGKKSKRSCRKLQVRGPLV